ncbi:UNVERIFIED_CONTAM: Protoporphyrinogen oxidase, mitochondrial [Sesamum latifolium]|uniref:Protoporphyrinogen oxidase, mitochondrial n=1 Tax=Sesamum latifolium TaxID=2727402 RepID=A0AAW2XC51_9LAMI
MTNISELWSKSLTRLYDGQDALNRCILISSPKPNTRVTVLAMASSAKEDKRGFPGKSVAVIGAGVSVGAFFQRHFGKEVVDYLIDPFVAGTSGGDPESLSMRHVFPELWNLEKRDELKQIVTSDLRQLLGAEGQPAFLNHFYWSKAFPLYGRNYDSVISAIDKMEKDLPGLFYAARKNPSVYGSTAAWLCSYAGSLYFDQFASHLLMLGNHKGGLSVGKAISTGCQAADLVISYLDSCSDTKGNT